MHHKPIISDSDAKSIMPITIKDRILKTKRDLFFSLTCFIITIISIRTSVFSGLGIALVYFLFFIDCLLIMILMFFSVNHGYFNFFLFLSAFTINLGGGFTIFAAVLLAFLIKSYIWECVIFFIWTYVTLYDYIEDNRSKFSAFDKRTIISMMLLISLSLGYFYYLASFLVFLLLIIIGLWANRKYCIVTLKQAKFQ